jgi:Glycoside hydrolase 123 N-terminal domain
MDFMNANFKFLARRTGIWQWIFEVGKVPLLVGAALVAVVFVIKANKSSAAAFPVWVASGLVRVGKTEAPGMTTSIDVSGARGEIVDAQIIVHASPSGLTNVNVSASDLLAPGGGTIPASNITLYRENYVTVTGTANYGGGSNPPLGSGTYAEPLIPFNDPETGAALCSNSAALKACNASVSAGQNQPYWIDISIPHGATTSPSGTYTGNIAVTSTQGTVTIPVSLTVWNFELPTQPSELSLWTLWPPAPGNTTTSVARALMRNKVMSWFDEAANASADKTNAGLNRSGLDYYLHFQVKCNGTHGRFPSASEIDSAAAKFPETLALDIYVGDELNNCPEGYPALKTIGAQVHATNRSVKTILTVNAPDTKLFDDGHGRSVIDHWALLASVEKWPELPFTGGGDLWSYTSCNTGYGNTPEWLVDYPPINERIQAGFLNWTQGATGILYYRSDGWTAGNTIGSWNNLNTNACGPGLGRPGDGIFLYPPGPIGSTEPAPGIRLKAIRDGIQDFEYAQLLKNQGQASYVDFVVKPIAASWTKWTHDPGDLENVRQKFGQQLHQVSHP